MANCFRCGSPILDDSRQIRRRVKTGGYERRRFSGSKVNTVQTHYGMRIVCSRCAKSLDREEYQRWLNGHLQVLAAVAVLLIVLLLGR